MAQPRNQTLEGLSVSANAELGFEFGAVRYILIDTVG